jgi:DNA polymerase-3 subunit delta'
MSEDTLPEPDRIDGAPHPRETATVIGQAEAEAQFLDAYTSGRLHHAWLLTGPEGVGKATLAWQIARFLLHQPPPDEGPGLFGDPSPMPTTLATDPNSPISRRMLAMAEPRLHLVRRGANDKGDRLMTRIGVDEVRKLGGFFALSAADGGWRVVIVDAVDEMNVNAANALLKILEEPPRHAVIVMISHQPARLLPTIRSRCRSLRLASLPPQDLADAVAAAGFEVPSDPAALAELAGGSAGRAVRLLSAGGLDLYRDLVALMSGCPRMDRPSALALADRAAARGATERLDLTFFLIDLAIARLARSGAGHPPAAEAAPGEAALLRRLSPDPAAARIWADLQTRLSARTAHGRAVNLDPATLILDTLVRINETAGQIAPRA